MNTIVRRIIGGFWGCARTNPYFQKQIKKMKSRHTVREGDLFIPKSKELCFGGRLQRKWGPETIFIVEFILGVCAFTSVKR